MSTPTLPPFATVSGHVEESASELAEAFSRAVSRIHGGAQFTLIVEGTTVLDVAGGSVQPDTPVQVFSVSKAVTSSAAAHAAQAGKLDLDQPLAAYWPAMNKASTKKITARMVLEHSCGIPVVSSPLTTDELLAGGLDRAIESQEPYWEPGTDHGYGAFTFGALMNGVFTHALGTDVSSYVAQNLTGPTEHNFWFGAPASELNRLAALSFDFPILTEGTAKAIMDGRALYDGSFVPIMSGAPFFFTDPRVIQANWPSLSGVTTASDMAHLFAAITGVSSSNGLLSEDTVADMTRQRRHGMDRTLHHVTRFGSGFELPHVYSPMFGGASFGHQGAGGSIVVADPERDVVVSFVSTHTQPTVGASDASLVLLAATSQWLAQR